MKNNVIKDKSYQFALRVIKLSSNLKNHHEYELAGQILRSGTSIGANVEEATAGQTKKDFIAKMSIASKEARETRYWIKLLDESQLVAYNYSNHLTDIDELIKILTSIVKSSQNSLQ